MSEQETRSSDVPPEMTEPSAPMTEQRHRKGLVQIGREHPVLTIAALAGAGLVGGIEMAAGVLLGAGIAAWLRRGPATEAAAESHEEAPGRLRRVMARAPHDLHELRERARAVVHAARGNSHAQPAQGEAAQSSRSAELP